MVGIPERREREERQRKERGGGRGRERKERGKRERERRKERQVESRIILNRRTAKEESGKTLVAKTFSVFNQLYMYSKKLAVYRIRLI